MVKEYQFLIGLKHFVRHFRCVLKLKHLNLQKSFRARIESHI
jgi:hypothetical protein